MLNSDTANNGRQYGTDQSESLTEYLGASDSRVRLSA